MAAATAAITATISFGLFSGNGIFSFSGSQGTELYLKQLAASTGVGALVGGITAEIFGGSFGQGALWGAAAAAASYVLTVELYNAFKNTKGLTACDDCDTGNHKPQIGDTYEQVEDYSVHPTEINPIGDEFNIAIKLFKSMEDPTAIDPASLVFEHGVNKATKAAVVDLLKKFIEEVNKNAQCWSAHLRIRTYEYKRGGFLWLRKVWKPVRGTLDWRPVTGGKGYDKDLKCYYSFGEAEAALKNEVFYYDHWGDKLYNNIDYFLGD